MKVRIIEAVGFFVGVPRVLKITVREGGGYFVATAGTKHGRTRGVGQTLTAAVDNCRLLTRGKEKSYDQRKAA